MDKKEVSGDIPFEFLEEMGHNTRAMSRFFELTQEQRENVLNHAAIGDDPSERISQTLKSLADGGEGYCEKY